MSKPLRKTLVRGAWRSVGWYMKSWLTVGVRSTSRNLIQPVYVICLICVNKRTRGERRLNGAKRKKKLRLEFRRSLVSGPRPSPCLRRRSASSFPEQRLVIKPWRNCALANIGCHPWGDSDDCCKPKIPTTRHWHGILSLAQNVSRLPANREKKKKFPF